tara:strand:- start:145 stop:297 length:153 start_codon:yes stop_codon:yes gene_type:complete
MNKTNKELVSVDEMMRMSLQEIKDYHKMVEDNANSAWHVKRVKEAMTDAS